jgi:hypothetical protein
VRMAPQPGVKSRSVSETTSLLQSAYSDYQIGPFENLHGGDPETDIRALSAPQRFIGGIMAKTFSASARLSTARACRQSVASRP